MHEHPDDSEKWNTFTHETDLRTTPLGLFTHNVMRLIPSLMAYIDVSFSYNDAFFSDDALETLRASLNNSDILKNTELEAPPRNPCLVRRSTEEPEMAVYAEGERFPIVTRWNAQLRAVEAEVKYLTEGDRVILNEVCMVSRY